MAFLISFEDFFGEKFTVSKNSLSTLSGLRFIGYITHNEHYLVKNKAAYIGLISRVFTYGPGDRGSISGRVIPKTQKMVLDAALLSTRYYKGEDPN